MRTLAKILYLIGFSLVATAPALALQSNQRDDAGAVIEQVMKLSGSNEQLEQLPKMMEADFEQRRPAGISDADHERFKGIVRDAFNAPRMQLAMTNALRKEYDAKRFTELLKLLNTPIARKMTDLELAAATPQIQQELMQYAASLNTAPPAPQRVELIIKLIDAMSGVETLVNIQAQSVEAMARAMDPILPPEQRLKPGELEQMIKDMRAQATPAAQQFLTLQGLYTCRSASDAELQEYLALYQSDTGRWFTPLMIRAMTAAFGDASTMLAQRMAEKAAQRKQAAQ